MASRRTPSTSPWLPWLAAWLVLGLLILALTPLTAWTALLGWGPAVWLVVTPLLMLLVAEPRLPLRLLAAWLRRERRRGGVPCAAGTSA